MGLKLVDDNGFVTDGEGNPVLDENGNQKQGYQLGVVTKGGDVQLIIKDFYDRVIPELPDILNICKNGNFYDGEESVKRIYNAMGSGAHTKFYEKYAYLQSPKKQEEYLKEGELEASEKLKVVTLELMMYHTRELRDKIRKFILSDVLTDDFIHSSAIITLDFAFQELYGDGVIHELIEVYKEFDEIMKIYTSSTIFKELGICDLKYTKKQAEEVVLQAMGMDVANTSYLKKYINYAIRMSPYGANTTYVCDRNTGRIYELIKNYDRIKSIAEGLKQLEDEMMGQYSLGQDPLLSYFDCYVRSLSAMKCVFTDAAMDIESFLKKEQVAPYSILHLYKDSAVDGTIRKYNLGPSGSEWKDGTHLSMTIQRMPQLLRETARNLAEKMPFNIE